MKQNYGEFIFECMQMPKSKADAAIQVDKVESNFFPYCHQSSAYQIMHDSWKVEY